MTELQTGLTQGIRRLGKLIIEPASGVQSREGRRRAQILSTVLFALIVLTIISRIGVYLTATPQSPVNEQLAPLFLISVTLLSACYAISRTQYYSIAAGIFVIIGLVAILWSVATTPTSSSSFLPYLIAGILVSSMMFSLRVTAAVTLAYISSAALVVSSYSALNLATRRFEIIFVLIAAGLILVFNRYRDMLETDRQQSLVQTQETLRISREQYRTLARNLPNTMVFLVDQETRIVLVEGQLLAGVDDSKETLEGQKVQDAFPGELTRLISDTSGKTLLKDERIRQLDYKGQIWLAHYLPIQNEDGVITNGMVVAQDMTARHRIERSLRESEARYRLIADNSTDIISVYLPTGAATYVSPASRQLLGYEPEELLGRSIFEISHPEDQFQIEHLLNAISMNVDTLTFAHRVHQKDGEYIWLETTFRIVRDEETREAQHIIAASRDVTERMQAQMALQQSEEQLRSLIASVDDFVFSIDLQGNILVYHHTRASVYDTPVSSDTFAGKHYTDILPAELTQQLDQAIDSVTKSLSTQQLEYNLLIDDKLHYFSARLTPMISPRIQLLGVTCIVRDVTEAVQARQRQQRLLELEQLHRSIAGVFLESDDSEKAIDHTLERVGKFLDVSRAYVFRIRANERLLDNTHEWCADGIASQKADLQGLAFDEIMPSLVPILTSDGILASDNIAELPEDLRHILEPQRVQSVLMLPFYINERLEGIIGFDDSRQPRRWLPEEIATLRTIVESYARILERDQAEYDLIRARDAALRSARLKSEFMSNMSHEIRTPMTGVIGMLELLRETALSEDQIEYVEIAHVSARRLMRLLDDILDFSKIEAGKVALESIPFDIRGIMTEVQANFATQAARKGLDLILDIDDVIPTRVLGDPTRVRQVLANLVSNAVKFTEQGHIQISLRQVGSGNGRTRLRFEIQDTGIGIPETQLETIFDSFVQADSSTTRRYGGTGLGLAICGQLVSLMGGRIDVQSVRGQGSAFAFTLIMPIVSLHERSTANMPFSEIQALVIDEENTGRYVLAQHLRQWGIGVIETTNLEKAKGILLSSARRNEEMSLVFVRTGLVQTDDWLEDIREQLDYQAPRFVLITDEQTDDAPPFDNVLRRPIRLSDLHNIVLRSAALPDTLFNFPDGSGVVIEEVIGRILLAEDDAMNWKIVVKGLSPLGYVVDLAHDGQEAVTMVEQNDYSMILMDVHMPVMDGLEATRRIRTLPPPKSEIPIIALTASVLNEEQQIYLEAGMNGFLGKPFSIDQLRKAVQNWTKHSA